VFDDASTLVNVLFSKLELDGGSNTYNLMIKPFLRLDEVLIMYSPFGGAP
jgi:hypothetical protein